MEKRLNKPSLSKRSMRTDDEVLEMITLTNELLDDVQDQITALKERTLDDSVDKKELFFKEVLPLFIVVNLLADRQSMLYWQLGRPVEVMIELNRLSKKTFEAIKDNLELFHKYI